MAGDEALGLEWSPGRPLDLAGTLGVHRRGAGDPAYRVEPGGAIWRACRTPAGPASVRVWLDRSAGAVAARAWGPGAGWVLDALPGWLGAADDPTGFDPDHPVLRELWRRYSSWRVGRTTLVMEALVPTVLEQKVTGVEARRSWRELLLRFGERAPGPAPGGMRVPPAARTWQLLPSWEWHRAGVGPQRSQAIVRAARLAQRLEETAGLPYAEARRRLQSVPGVGAWTVAEIMQRAHGDPDAVSVGDYHLPRIVGWALLGRDLDDAGMLAQLDPWRGHRYRVTKLCELSGRRPERRGPRVALRDYRAI